MGNILFKFGYYDYAKDEFNTVLKISPDYSWAYYNLACIAFEENDYQAVADNLDRTLELNPKDENAYLNYAKLLLKMNMYDEVKTVMETAIQNCSAVGQLNYYMAKFAQKAGNIEDYELFLNQAISNRETLKVDIYRVMAELEKLQDDKES